VDSLRQNQEYQLLYVEDGVATGEELQSLKVMSDSGHYGF
jgi:hypothetical protein